MYFTNADIKYVCFTLNYNLYKIILIKIFTIESNDVSGTIIVYFFFFFFTETKFLTENCACVAIVSKNAQRRRYRAALWPPRLGVVDTDF